MLSADGDLLGQLSVEPVFGWYAVIPLAMIMLASLWLTLSTKGISLGGRMTLMGLRLLAVLILLLGWLRPGIVSTSSRESAGAIAVLMDRSQSMTLPSGSSNQNRWEVQKDIWSAIEASTDLKIGQTQIIPYFYDRGLYPAATDDMPGLDKTFAGEPTGRLTDLGKTLASISRQQIDPPLRGVILMGDATQTLRPPEIDATVAARQMAQLDQPILLVGIGPRAGKSQLSDIALEGMPEHFSAFVNKELSVPLVVHAQGMQNLPVRLTLTLRASGKTEQKVAAREVLASRPNEKLPLEFKVLVPEEGEYLLEAKAVVDAREQIQTNNVALSFVTVREGGVKILYLEGQPRAEQTFLKRSLHESLDFDVEYLWLGEKQKRQWPIDLTPSMDIPSYDAFVLGDLDSKALARPTAEAIASRVGQGAGLLLLGGYHSFDAGGYGRSPLAPLFPTQLKLRPQQWDRPIDPSLHISGDVRLEPKRPHPITTLMPEPDNTRLWRNLPPLQGMNLLGALRSSPAIQILLESQDGDPALVTGEYSRGRVLAFAGDSTWQWWLSGKKKIHQQFWRQAMLWLVGRDSVNEGFRLNLDRRRFQLDETPTLAVEWFGGSENKPMPERIKIELSRDGQWLQNLASKPVDANLREAKITGLGTPGLYRAALTCEASDGEAYSADMAFIVRDESRELAQPAADWQMMNNIVSANRSAGGQLLLPEDVGKAIEWLRKRQDATKVTTLEKRRLGDAAWDAWLYLTLFCVLMSVEWGLRKSWQLP